MELYSIGQVARQTGVSVKAVRYYSDIGLLPPVRVSEAGYRLYGDSELTRLQQIATVRFLGASIQDVRELLADEKALTDFLTARAGAVDAEIERLGRLRKVISQAREDVERREDPRQYLQNLKRVAGMTSEERGRWWAGRWRKLLSGYPVPEEFVADAEKSRESEASQGEMGLIMAAQNGRDEEYVREGNERMAQSKGMDSAGLRAKIEDMMNRFRLVVHKSPGDPAVQLLVDEYVAFAVGSVSEAGLKRTLDLLSQPLFHRMFQMADMTDPDAQGEMFHRLILEAMRFRLERISVTDDPGLDRWVAKVPSGAEVPV
ncbi:MAG TPA: MerR family transcriptional regulator [Spirochaetia bacterium]|nr:MerR family transcriptional regulator [Spirochaetia bacterium]